MSSNNTTDEESVEFKRLWLETNGVKQNSSCLTKQKFSLIVASLQDERSNKHNCWYGWNKKFMVTEVQGKVRLLYRPPKGMENIPMDQLKEAVCIEDAFEIISRCHIENGHPKGLSLFKRIEGKYGKSITRDMCTNFSNLCPACQRQTTKKPTQAGHTPMLSEGLGARYQIDLIDFQYLHEFNGPFRWLLNCQDHAGKFIVTKALTKKTVKEVSHALLDIFSTIGPPNILQSDNGREFSNMASTRRVNEEEEEDQQPRVVAFQEEEVKQICKEISDLWPGTVIVHGKPRRSTTQGSVERSNQHIEVCSVI